MKCETNRFKTILTLSLITFGVLSFGEEPHETIKHRDDYSMVTSSKIRHLELLTCRYCESGKVDSVLQFINYDLPHYSESIKLNYKGKPLEKIFKHRFNAI